jgi:hypothetical protein
VSDYQDYKARFEESRALLKVPEDCTARIPRYNAIDLVDPKSWDFCWFLVFGNNDYICCRESWAGRPPKRHYLSFHYGPIVRVDNGGNIERDQNNPLMIRICKSKDGIPHLHYRHPHPFPDYKQSQIDGLVLEDVDMFQFVQAVFRSRSNNEELHVTMGFADPTPRT